MPDLKGLKAGDPIMVPRGWSGPEYEEKTVSKVGRKYLYVGEGYPRQFSIEYGHEAGDYTGRAALTVERFAEISAREAAVATFVRLGVPGGAFAIGRWVETLDFEQIRKLVEILEPAP